MRARITAAAATLLLAAALPAAAATATSPRPARDRLRIQEGFTMAYLRALPTARLRAHDPDAVYRVERLDDTLADKPTTLSGAALMERGLTFDLRGDFDATAVLLERVD